MKCKLETFNQSISSKVTKPQKHRLWFHVSTRLSEELLFEFQMEESAFSKKQKQPERNKPELNQTPRIMHQALFLQENGYIRAKTWKINTFEELFGVGFAKKSRVHEQVSSSVSYIRERSSFYFAAFNIPAVLDDIFSSCMPLIREYFDYAFFDETDLLRVHFRAHAHVFLW